MNIKKTNAVRLLDNLNINYALFTYEVDEEDLSGKTVALKIGAEAESVFKTLVARGESGRIFVFCIPVTEELNLKKAALAANEKNIEMIKMAELLPLTGYVRGGCSPLAMKKEYPVIVDETVQLFEEIYFSAGVRGMQIKLRYEELLKAAKAVLADLI